MAGSRDDDEFLDEVLDRAVTMIQQGGKPGVELFVSGRPHLYERIVEQIRLAGRVLPRPGPDRPTVSGYTIVHEAGRGGMGTVYLARQNRLSGRTVALKVLSDSSAMSPDARRRFRQESQIVARLRHPNIVAVHDVACDEGQLAYAMEWVQGRSLAAIIDHLRSDVHATRPGHWVMDQIRLLVCEERSERGGVLGAESYTAFVCRVGMAIARALGAVHREGLLHRDVKPSNILVRDDGGVLLTDFGLARERAGPCVTQVGEFLGTPAYAAPEQLRGESLDQRGDVYALGATLYHSLVLRAPCAEPDRLSILRRIESGRVEALRSIDRRIPRDLDTIVGKAMEADAGRRYATADELADDIERLLGLRPIRARPAGVVTRAAKFARRNRRGLAGGVAGCVTTGVVGALLLIQFSFVPRWAETSLRQARMAVLDPMQSDRVWSMIYRGRTLERPETDSGSLSAARRNYARMPAMASVPESVRLEREVVRIAAGLGTDAPIPAWFADRAPLTDSYARAWADGQPLLLKERLDEASPDDLRALGLLAFLCHDVGACVEAWRRLNLARAPDPFVEATLGQVYLANGEPSRAYPLLLSAARAFSDVGFLWTDVAYAAVQNGDPDDAERLLELCEGMRFQDGFANKRDVILTEISCVRSEHARAIGDEREADRLDQLAEFGELDSDGGWRVRGYRYFLDARQAPNVRDRFARFLARRGRLRESLEVRADLVRLRPTAEMYRRRLVESADRWWGALDFRERCGIVRDAVADPGFVRLLDVYTECRGTLDAEVAAAGGDRLFFEESATFPVSFSAPDRAGPGLEDLALSREILVMSNSLPGIASNRTASGLVSLACMAGCPGRTAAPLLVAADRFIRAGAVCASVATAVVTSVAWAQPQCVLQYDFERQAEEGGNLLLDSSNFGAPLDMTKFVGGTDGTPLQYADDSPITCDGHDFGGTSLRIGHSYSLGFMTPSQGAKHELQRITVEAWVKVAANSSGGAVFAHVPKGAGCIGRGWSLSVASQGVGFVVGAVGQRFRVLGLGVPETLAPDTWHHVAGSYDGVTLRVFFDGIQVGSTPGAGDIDYDKGDVPPCNALGPNPTATYIGAAHNNNPSGPTGISHLVSLLSEGTLVDRARVLNDAVAGVGGDNTPAPALDYYYCHVAVLSTPLDEPSGPRETADFVVDAVGEGPFTYRWQREVAPDEFVDLSDGATSGWDGDLPGRGGIVSGATTAHMTLSPDLDNGKWLSDAHSVRYRCRVSALCERYSEPSRLVVCAAEFNGDHALDFFDYLDFAQAFASEDPNADVNRDGQVDFFDYLDFIVAFGAGCG